MTVRHAHPRRHAAVLSLLIGLAACAGSPATRYFTLAGTPERAQGPATAYAGAPIEVRLVQVPPAIDRLEMVRERRPGEVEVLDFDHWAAPLGRLARQALTEDLAQRLPAGKTVNPGAAWPEPRAVLTVDILSYTNRDGTARMSLSWTLQPPPERAGAALAATLEVQVPAAGDAAADAQAWSELLGRVADRIVERLGNAGAA